MQYIMVLILGNGVPTVWQPNLFWDFCEFKLNSRHKKRVGVEKKRDRKKAHRKKIMGGGSNIRFDAKR